MLISSEDHAGVFQSRDVAGVKLRNQGRQLINNVHQKVAESREPAWQQRRGISL